MGGSCPNGQLQEEAFPRGVVHVHPKGWMDEPGMQKWLQEVWRQGPCGLQHCSLLVLDLFWAHTTDGVKKTMRDVRSDMAVIPGGLTSVLQPLEA